MEHKLMQFWKETVDYIVLGLYAMECMEALIFHFSPRLPSYMQYRSNNYYSPVSSRAFQPSPCRLQLYCCLIISRQFFSLPSDTQLCYGTISASILTRRDIYPTYIYSKYRSQGKNVYVHQASK